MIKKILVLIICILFITGCVSDLSETSIEKEDTQITENEQVDNSSETKEPEKKIGDYKIGEEISLAGIKFNVYKIDKSKKELYLLAQKNIIITKFSDEEHTGYNANIYEGSLVEGYVNGFVDTLEDKGYKISKSGIIDKDDMQDLGCKDSVTVSGRPYLCEETPEFLHYEEYYWLGGYYKVDSYAWAYYNEKIDTQKCEYDYFGVRPSITIKVSEVNKKTNKEPEELSIKEIVNSNYAWTSEGGIHNEYDRFYFDLENMRIINEFKSSALEETREYKMEFVDDKTIRIDGLMRHYEIPAELTIVNENKLRLRFVDNKYNDGDYFLNKTKEIKK